MKTFHVKPLPLALFVAFAGTCSFPASAALLTLSPAPLFVTSATKANVLLILDNSNSMDETATGEAAPCVSAKCGSASPLSKSEIARGAAKSIVSNYTGKINLGLMAYQQATNSLRQLHNSPYDVSYNPADYNSAWTGNRASPTNKRFRAVNPTSAGDYVYYNIALPFYSSSNDGNAFCYSDTATAAANATHPEGFWNTEVFPGGPWDKYRCYSTKTGTSNVLPAMDGTGASAAGYSTLKYAGATFSATDSDIAQSIYDFGRFLTWTHVGPTWFANTSPGRGYLHVTVDDLNGAKATAVNTKLGTSQFVTNGPTDATLPLQNAGLTPMEGTLLTAKDYFAGSLTATAEGGSKPAPPAACGKDFVVYLTDGMPSTRADGSTTGVTVAQAADAAYALKTATRPVKTYMVGFALPYGVPAGALDTIAASGGTGAAFDANDSSSLNSAFGTIFNDILAQSGAAAAVALTSGSVIAGGKVFQGGFNSADWSGDLTAYNIDSTTGAITTIAWRAGPLLNTQDFNTGRSILTFKPSSKKGIPFRWPSAPASPTVSELDSGQILALNTNATGTVDDDGANRLDFLRGKTGIAGYRGRPISVLGDLVGSAPAYVGPPSFNYPESIASASYAAFRAANASRVPMIYVGANDGMMHAFDATTGLEKLAYVPSLVYRNLPQLTSTSYTHRYFVDGSPSVVDVFYGGAWKTVLVASLGQGGQGLFALDVTNPAAFNETNAPTLVRWEFTDPDLGYVNGQPSLVKMNNGKWAAVFGSGYNNSEADGSASTTGYAYLFVVDIETGILIEKISTKVGTPGTPNGLATPALVDEDGDGDVDYAYAGDLLGNMWKFDLTTSNSNQWKVAYGSSTVPEPLFVAKDAGGVRQPITSSPDLTRHFSGDGFLVYFGTGKYLEAGDLATTSKQTFYSVWDKIITPSTISGRAELQEQTITSTVIAGKTYRVSSSNTVNWATRRGWYMDLPDAGERTVSDAVIFGNRVLFTTLIPNTAACGSGGTGWLMELDAISGSAVAGPTFDVDGNGVVDTADYVGSPGVYGSGVKQNAIPSAVKLQKNAGGTTNNSSLLKRLSLSDKTVGTEINKSPSVLYKASWRQIFE